jgi:dienelactone hydrolase
MALAAALLVAAAGIRFVRGFSLVVRAADLQGPIRVLADFDVTPVRERVVRVSAGEGSFRARIYEPDGSARQTVLLVPGLHPAGLDEPRLMVLARRLAETGMTVVTLEVQELMRFEITPVVTDRIERAAAWLAADSGLAASGRIGLMGVSFSGGLSIVAAGRPSLRDRLLYVFSFGGHDDLRRVLEYLCGGVAPDAPRADARADDGRFGVMSDAGPPHDYGVAVLLLNVVERVVPAHQVEPLQSAVRRFLVASYLDRFDKQAASREYAALREVAATLPEPAASLLGYVNDRDVARLGPLLYPHIWAYADAPALSPSRSPSPVAPVFLLHGRSDTVIPAAESQYLADRLEGVPVRLLLTDLISHAEANRPAHFADVARLVAFWSDLLSR